MLDNILNLDFWNGISIDIEQTDKVSHMLYWREVSVNCNKNSVHPDHSKTGMFVFVFVGAVTNVHFASLCFWRILKDC